MKINRVILGMLAMVLIASCLPQENLVQGVHELKKGSSIPLVTPIWSPAGDSIIASYIEYQGRRSTIYEYDIATSDLKALVTIDGEAVAQSWSIDGATLAVAISGSITFSDDGIWVFNIIDGSNHYIGPGEAASWSPDGHLLAIYSCEQLSDGISTVATVRLVNLSQERMEEEILFRRSDCLKLAYMSWSSDNKNIVFSFSQNRRTENHLDQIFIVDIPTKEVNKILDEGNWSPSFSPIDDRVVFVNNYALAISDRAGACQLKVKDLGIDVIGDVSWSPDGAQWAVSGLGNIYIIDIRKFMGRDIYQSTPSCQ